MPVTSETQNLDTLFVSLFETESIALSSSEKEIRSKISCTPKEQKQNATTRNDYSAERKPLETSAHDTRTSFSFGCTTRHGRPRTREICRKIGVWSACVPFRNREKPCCVQWYVRACVHACVSKRVSECVRACTETREYIRDVMWCATRRRCAGIVNVMLMVLMGSRCHTSGMRIQSHAGVTLLPVYMPRVRTLRPDHLQSDLREPNEQPRAVPLYSGPQSRWFSSPFFFLLFRHLFLLVLSIISSFDPSFLVSLFFTLLYYRSSSRRPLSLLWRLSQFGCRLMMI